jgi:hypothetical protein
VGQLRETKPPTLTVTGVSMLMMILFIALFQPKKAENFRPRSAFNAEEFKSHKEVKVDLPFMATISLLGNREQETLSLRTCSSNSEEKPDDNKHEMCANRLVDDDESARALKIRVAANWRQFEGKEISSSVATHLSPSTRGSCSTSFQENLTKSKVSAGGRGTWGKIRNSSATAPASREVPGASREGAGLLAWMENKPQRNATDRKSSLSLPCSPVASLVSKSGRPMTSLMVSKFRGLVGVEALREAAGGGMRSATSSMRTSGVQSMPASPLLALGPTGSYSSSFGRQLTATGVVGICVCVCVCVRARARARVCLSLFLSVDGTLHP